MWQGGCEDEGEGEDGREKEGECGKGENGMGVCMCNVVHMSRTGKHALEKVMTLLVYMHGQGTP